MRKTVKSVFVIAFAMTVVFVAGSLPKAIGAEGPAQLNGRWNFVPDQSDNVALKIRKAKESARANSYDEFPHMSSPGGAWGSMDGPQGNINPSSDLPKDSDPVWDRLAKNPKTLSIEQRSDQIVITDDSGQAQTFYPDSKKHHEKDANGKKATTLAGWVKNAFVAKTQISGSRDISQSFTISADGQHLIVKTSMEIQSLGSPVVVIRRVYDLEKPPAT